MLEISTIISKAQKKIFMAMPLNTTDCGSAFLARRECSSSRRCTVAVTNRSHNVSLLPHPPYTGYQAKKILSSALWEPLPRLSIASM